MVIPSQAPIYLGEGVETRREASKFRVAKYDEGIVQTTNFVGLTEAVKTVAGKKIQWPYRPYGFKSRPGYELA